MAKQKRSWFFEVTRTQLIRGVRFVTGDKPSQKTMEALLDSSTLKSEVGDRAKVDDSGIDVSDLNGHVVLSKDEDVKSNASQVEDRSKVVQPHQMTTARGVTESDLDLSLDTINNTNQISDPIVFKDTAIKVEDEGTTRNDYLISFKESFRNFLSSLVTTINSMSLKLVGVISQAETNRLNIVDLKALDGDVDAFINGLNPKGTIIASVLGVGMDPEFWVRMDGSTPLSKYVNDNVNDGSTDAWTLFEGLGIIADDGDLKFGFIDIGSSVFDSSINAGNTVSSLNDWKTTFTQSDIPKHTHGNNLATSIEGGHRHQYGTVVGKNDNNLTDAFAAGADRAFDSDLVPTRSWWTDEFNTPDESTPSGNPDKLVAISGQPKGGRRGFHKHNITGSISNYGSQSTTYPSLNVPRVGVYYYIKIK